MCSTKPLRLIVLPETLALGESVKLTSLFFQTMVKIYINFWAGVGCQEKAVAGRQMKQKENSHPHDDHRSRGFAL